MRNKNSISVEELFDLAAANLRQGLERPNIYGYTPYPEQEAFHRCSKVGRYLAGGNRGGKTDAMVAEMVYWATDTHPWLKRPDEWGTGALQLRCFVVDVEKGVNQILLPKLRRYIPTSFLIDGDFDQEPHPHARERHHYRLPHLRDGAREDGRRAAPHHLLR